MVPENFHTIARKVLGIPQGKEQKKNTKEIGINHKGTRMVKDGED